MIQSIMVGVSFWNKRAHFKVSAKKQVKGAGKEKRKGGQREKDRDRKRDRQTDRQRDMTQGGKTNKEVLLESMCDPNAWEDRRAGSVLFLV